MYNHASAENTCFFCCLIKHIDCTHNNLLTSDIVVQNEMVTAFMATRRFPNNQGHVLVIPNEHFENIYDFQSEFALPIHKLTQQMALAMKETYRCDGILIRQHNEPAGGQHIWHYHLHIIPRYEKDDFHKSQKRAFPPVKRVAYAQMLRNWIGGLEHL